MKGENPKVVMKYGPGGYFGELALLKDVARAASIIAQVEFVIYDY